MFAVIQTGGKQYRVTPGSSLLIERIDGEEGQSVIFDRVLCAQKAEGELLIGTPSLKEISVRATLVRQARGDKVIVFKKRRRNNSRKKAGHRQDLTLVKIEEICI